MPWLLALVAMALLLPAAPALGHAAFVGSKPAPGARLSDSPARVVLTFTEPLNRGLSRVTLLAPNGSRIPVVTIAAADRRLVLRPGRPLDAGAYELRWHTVSTEDGHALEGSFAFGVRADAASAAHDLEQSPLARDGWIRVLARGVLYVAVLLFAAGVLLPILLRGSPSWLAPAALTRDGIDVTSPRRRELRLVGNLAWLSLVAAVGATLAEAADAAGGLSAAGARDFLLSGSAGAARLAVVGALLVAAGAGPRRPRLAATGVVLALWGIAASGHASSATPRAPSVLVDWLHLISGAVWVGGIGLLVLVWAPALRRRERSARAAVARHVLPRFGRVALPAFLLVVLTGVLSLLTQLGDLEALWTTAYGRVLAVKVVVVALLAGVSATHAWRLRPRLPGEREPPSRLERRHWRLVVSEPLLGVFVVAAVALLVAFPLPPRQLADAGEAVASSPACDPCPLPEPRAGELPVADQAGSRVVAAWVRRDDEGSSGTVRVLDLQGDPIRAPFEVLGAEQAGCGVGCRRFRLASDTLRVAVPEGDRRFVARLPSRWNSGQSRRARTLLERAQRSMRGLRSVREVERVTSGPGSFALTTYRLRAPDRMAFATNRGVRSVIIDERQWLRSADAPWTRRSYGAGIPFSLARWFRWTSYATAVRLLRRSREDGRRVSVLALMDPATPVWLRLVIDEGTGRVLRERMVTPGHFMRSRYLGFNQPVSVKAPDVD